MTPIDPYTYIARQISAGRHTEADSVIRQLLAQNPNDARALHFGGLLAHSRKDLKTAYTLMKKSIELDETVAAFHNNLGEVHRAANDFENAEKCYRKALELDPNLADAETNLGLVLANQDKLDEAIEHDQRAISLNPKLPQPRNNLGIVYAKLGRLNDAVSEYRKAVELDPNYAQAQSNLLLALNYLPNISRAEIFKAHHDWGRRIAATFASAVKPHRNDRDKDRRIRIGYVSPDFRKHSVAYLVEPLIANHDHNNVHITCYSDVLIPDDTTRRIKRLADSWRDTAALSHQLLAEQIRHDEIDILVDLAGHTASNRIPMFGFKPAPIAMTLHGYPNTTGLPTIDYRITDNLADPPGVDIYYSETLIRLPRLAMCFAPSPEAPEISPLPAIKNKSITFGSFNNVYKITKPAAELWARILKQIPESKLLVLVAKGSEHQVVRDLFTSAGVESSRVQLEPKRPRKEYLELINTVDIALDPFPYNGTITTCETLWQGVPVISLAGDMAVSRMGHAILNSVGLGAFSAASVDDYFKIAVTLCTDMNKLSLLRNSLRNRLRSSPLLDCKDFAMQLERAYRTAWQTWCSQ